MVIDNFFICCYYWTMPMMDHSKMTLSEVEKVKKMVMVRDKFIKKPEYNPTYGTTYDRVMERGYVICGTNDEFPGFSEEVYDNEDGTVVWKGFDVDICRAVAVAVFGDIDAIQFEIIDGVTRFTDLIDGSIDKVCLYLNPLI